MILKEKVIVVAGGSGLIGRAIVQEALKQGAITYNVDIIPTVIQGAINLITDITQPDNVIHLIDKIISDHDSIDGFINCSYPRTADWGKSTVELLPYGEWAENVDKHLNSYYYVSQQVLRVMKEQQYGALVNFASIYGVVGNDFTIYEGLKMNPPGAYSAIKGGIINLSRYFASYFGKFNVRVNCLSPGGIFDNQNPDFVKRYEERVPMKRMGSPDDIAPVACFLVSDGAKYITGQNIIVDGGWTCI